jgi:hypothetical protein
MLLYYPTRLQVTNEVKTVELFLTHKYIGRTFLGWLHVPVWTPCPGVPVCLLVFPVKKKYRVQKRNHVGDIIIF